MSDRSINSTMIVLASVMALVFAHVNAAPAYAAEAVKNAAPEPAAPDTYVGSAKCRICHLPQSKSLAAFASDTAGTARMLLNAGVTTDSKTAGHSNAGDPRFKRETLQCESCHGMGSRHLALGANRDSAARKSTINLPDGTECRVCHSVHATKR